MWQLQPRLTKAHHIVKTFAFSIHYWPLSLSVLCDLGRLLSPGEDEQVFKHWKVMSVVILIMHTQNGR